MRRPFGMPSWAYWVIAFVVAGLLGNIPAVGMALTAGVLIAALVYWVRLPKQLPPGFVPITRVEAVKITSRQEIVGESHYQPGIARVVAAHGRKVTAALVHEPKNRHSASGTAVRVDLQLGGEWVTCGYLPAAVSTSWAQIVSGARREGVLLVCDADIRGGWENAPSYGVWLTPPPKRKPSFEPVADRGETSEFWSKQEPQA